MRRGLFLVLLFGCGAKELPVTGGFRETIIDKSIRHGQGLEVADVDGDGMVDVVAAFSLTDAVHLYVNAGAGEFDPVSISGPGSIVARDVTTLDVDGDSDLDVAAVGLTQRKFFTVSAGEVVWYENPGDPFGQWVTRPISRPDTTDTSSKSVDLPWGACCIAAGDLDGDGIDDLVVGQRNVTDDQGTVFGNRVVWYQNQGNLFFVGPLSVDGNLQDVSSVLIADVDGDDRLDVIAGADMGQQVAWYRNEATQDGLGFRKFTIWDQARPHGIVFTDADGDQDPELVVAAYAMTTSISLSIFEPPAVFSEPWTRTEVAGGFGRDRDESPRVVVADFDGDGSMDLGASSLGRGDLRVYRRTGTSYEQGDVRGGYLGLNGMEAADVDGDGRIDLVTSTFEFGSRDRISWWRNESF
jgi:hypothetical protein